MKWEEKLNKFIDNLEFIDDVVGILVCGSYITGSPTKHSDLDVHLILDDKVNYRERGNRIVDGLLIEYFANPKKQIIKYFKEDYKNIRPMSQTQFITGKIIMDKKGIDTNLTDLEKYAMWDMLDDLEDIYSSRRDDFDLIYYCNLDKLIGFYMKQIKYPYNKKAILGHIRSDVVRDKYLLEEIKDEEFKELIEDCIIAKSKDAKIKFYRKLTNKIFELVGGFNIDNFKYRSDVE